MFLFLIKATNLEANASMRFSKQIRAVKHFPKKNVHMAAMPMPALTFFTLPSNSLT